MPHRPARVSLPLLAVLAFTASAQAQLGSVRIASGLDQPLFVTQAPGDPNRLFVVERGGDIEILARQTDGTWLRNATPFLSITDDFTAGGGEQGLLGLAFAPDYPTSGTFYVNLTNANGDTQVRRYQRSTADLANATGDVILQIDQPQANHNGGWIGFDPTATGAAAHHLYIATGDGGGSDDNDNDHTAGIGNAQDITGNLLGKILRVDVSGDDFAADDLRDYAIVDANPFVGTADDDEILAHGLRNPFRASFDRLTGELYIGDVGQGAREEIDRFDPTTAPVSGQEPVRNFGWRLREGAIATPSGSVGGSPPANNVEPIYDYLRGSGDFQGTTVTGGYVYRGPVAELQGLYVFGDFGSGHLWAFDPDDPHGTIVNLDDELAPDVSTIANISSFGEGLNGDLFIVKLFGPNGGEVFMVIPEPAGAAAFVAGALLLRRGRPRRFSAA